MEPKERLAMLLNDLQKQGVVIEPKSTGWYWKTMGGLLKAISFGNIDFFHGTTTTVGNLIGTPDDWDLWGDVAKYEALLHESEHVKQYKRFGFGNAWVGLIPVGIAYLFLPFPIGLAYCRARLEFDAYCQSLRAIVQVDGAQEARDAKSFFVSQFTSVNYLFMWPFKSQVEKWFDEALDRIIAEENA